MNEDIKEQISNLDIAKYRSPTGRMKKDAPPEVKSLIKISEFVEVHGWDTYDYSHFHYTSNTGKGKILCPEHGIFEMTPGNHKKGQGCPACANARGGEKLRKSPEKAIKDFIQVHGDEYDYSKTTYVTAKIPVIVTCKVHGDFTVVPNKHLSGEGCPKCRYIKSSQTLTKPLDLVLEDFRLQHGDLYDYSKVVYTRAKDKVEIICKTHGSFWQTPDNHRAGSGCPKCMNKNGETNIVYLLKCQITGLYKIGITNNLAKRMQNIGGQLLYVAHAETGDPRSHEKHLHFLYRAQNMYNEHVNNGGTEFFQLSQEQVQEVIHYLESVQQGEF